MLGQFPQSGEHFGFLPAAIDGVVDQFAECKLQGILASDGSVRIVFGDKRPGNIAQRRRRLPVVGFNRGDRHETQHDGEGQNCRDCGQGYHRHVLANIG